MGGVQAFGFRVQARVHGLGFTARGRGQCGLGCFSVMVGHGPVYFRVTSLDIACALDMSPYIKSLLKWRLWFLECVILSCVVGVALTR